MKQAKLKSATATPEFKNLPDKFDDILTFHGDWNNVPNSLFADEKGNLFLGEVELYKVDRRKLTKKDVEPVTLVEALNWYVRCNQFAGGFDGGIDLLCEMASAKLATQLN